MRTQTIYISQLDLPAGQDSWHPVSAEHIDGELYRILDSLPDHHDWQFEKGDVVQCRPYMFAPGVGGMVAYGKVDGRA